MDRFGCEKGVMTIKLKLTDPMTSIVVAATIGTLRSPCNGIRFDPRIVLNVDRRATPRPTIRSFEPAYVGTMSKRILTLDMSLVLKVIGSVLMFSWTGKSITVDSPSAPDAETTIERAVSSCVVCASEMGMSSNLTASTSFRGSMVPRLTKIIVWSVK